LIGGKKPYFLLIAYDRPLQVDLLDKTLTKKASFNPSSACQVFDKYFSIAHLELDLASKSSL